MRYSSNTIPGIDENVENDIKTVDFVFYSLFCGFFHKRNHQLCPTHPVA